MSRKKACVAVIGSQGCGKSSLLNSLLFSERVLPTGQGITTNAICYVEDAKDTRGRTEVTLTTGIVEGPLDIKFLSAFMDEKQNPDNQKGVSEIHCFAHSAFLSENTAFVDTPGLGSTKGWHDKTTFTFAADMALGVAVIRSEQLKESESEFIKTIWSLSPQYIFVQNVWGEPPDQVEARLQEHRRKLQEIAKECGDVRPVSVLAVNIHEGLEGATNNNVELLEKSGLAKLKLAVAAQTDRGGQRLEVDAQSQRIVMLLRRGVISADRQMYALQSARNSEDLIGEHRQARDKIKKLQTEADEAEDQFRRRHRNCVDSFRVRFERAIDQISRDFRQRVQVGDVDDYFASDLHAAMKHCIAGEVQQLQEDLSDIEAAYIRGAIQRAEAAFSAGAPKSFENTNVSGSHFAEWAGNVVVGAGSIALTSLTAATIGTVITTVTAGGTAGTGLMLALAGIPGAGWAIAGGLVGVGAVIRFVSRESRKGKLIQELARVSSTTSEQAVKSVTEACKERRDQLIDVVGTHFRGLVAQQKKETADIEAKLKLGKDELEREVSNLTQKKMDLVLAIRQIEMSAK